jgi:predicted alpha/beta-fold hydrolase
LIGHLETLRAALLPPPRVAFQRERWDTPDGDFIDVDFAGDVTLPRRAVLFHGLEGCSDSHYARTLARALPPAGWRVAIPHWRGCSGEPNRLPRAYHSGDSAEVDWLLRKLSHSHKEPVDAVGISLGGNALLKWLGERGAGAGSIVHRAAAISAPLDLAAAGRALDRGLNRLLYTRMFLSTLKPKSLAKLASFPGIFDAARVHRARTFREFDDAFTAPLHGFRGVDHYWSASSSGPWLERISVPTLVLNARNDPFLPEQDLLAAAQRPASCVLLEFPPRGGHVGFSGHWLATRLLEFFQK